MRTAEGIRASVVRVSAALLLAVIIGESASAQPAQSRDPIIGTWTLNPAATQASPGLPFPPPAQRTEVYRATESGQIALAVTTSGSSGSPTTSTMVFSARGGIVTQENGPPGQVLIETRMAPGRWRVTYLANGVQFLTMEKVVSADGKSMRQTFTGETPQGAPFEGVLMFERQ